MISPRSSKELNNATERHTSPRSVEVFEVEVSATERLRNADNSLLALLGYRAEFKREFSASFELMFLYDMMLIFSIAYRDNSVQLLDYGNNCFCDLDV
jgi:hypothetical protein